MKLTKAAISGGILMILLVVTGFAKAESRVRVSRPSPFLPGCDEAGGMLPINYQNAEVEPWLVIDPNNPAHLVGIWQQDRWGNGGAHGLTMGVSRDRGQTWRLSLAHFSRCEGGNAGNGGGFGRVSDPWITISPNGVVYASGLSFDSPPGNEAMLVVRSTDGGNTWSEPATLIFDSDPTILDDKDTITADPLQSRFVYAVWERDVFTDPTQETLLRGPIVFTRSIDGGATWEPVRTIYDPGNGVGAIDSEIVVLPSGTLVQMFGTWNTASPQLFVMRSTDQGKHWSRPTVINSLQDIGVVDVETGEPIRGGAAHITVAPGSGTLYLVWQDARFSGGMRDGIALSKSTDGGVTWSPPIQVNQAPNVQAFAPSIAIGQNGQIAITYYDFRKDTPDPTTLLTNFWQITSQDGGNTWQEVPLIGSFDIRSAPNTGLGFMVGDYEGLVPLDQGFISLFVRANSGDTSNPTDILAVSARAETDTSTDGHVEINLWPSPPKKE